MEAREVLFDLLRSEICGGEVSAETVSCLDGQILSEVYKLSVQHDLAHIAGKALEKLNISDCEKVLSLFQKQTMLAIYRYVQLDHEYIRICQALEKLQIPHLPLKGSVLRAHYPEPWMRTSSDIDILVKEEDLDPAVDMLIREMGYTKHSKNAHHVSMASARDVRLEMHYSLLEEQYSETRNQMLGQMWQIATPMPGFTFRYEMPDEMFYFYHIAHMAKHVVKGGCGIRPLLDMWILNHRICGDRQKREALLIRGDLLSFEQEMVKLSEAWFSGGEKDAVSEQLEQFLLTGGANGSLENSVAARKQNSGNGIRYIFSRVFVGYNVLHGYYPILEKHRYLQPFCWLHWWLKRVFRGGGGRLAQELRVNAKVSAKTRNSTAELFEKLGL